MSELKPGWKTWGGNRCNHCCTGMGECDDSTHHARENCPYCGGSGNAEWITKYGEIDSMILAWESEGGKFSASEQELFIRLLIASHRRTPEPGQPDVIRQCMPGEHEYSPANLDNGAPWMCGRCGDIVLNPSQPEQGEAEPIIEPTSDDFRRLFDGKIDLAAFHAARKLWRAGKPWKQPDTRPAPRAAMPDEFLSDAVLDNVKAVIRHWNEFGPDHGFNERMDRLYEAFEAAPEQGGV